MQQGRRTEYVPLNGAVDITTQDLKRNPGSANFAVNYEPGLEDSFRRIDGYEVFDGQTSPSSAIWYVVELTDASDRLAGQTLTGAAGASCVIIAIDGDSVAFTAWDGDDFVAGETTNGAGNVVDVQLVNGSLTNYSDVELELLAQNHYRALIQALPGTGATLGVWMHQGSMYAFRNSNDGTRAHVYKATTAGWDALPLHNRLNFDAGSAAFVYGEIVTSASGTAIVRKVLKLSGEWDTNNAAGYMMLEWLTGWYVDNETLTGSIAGSATADGGDALTTLLPNGRYELISHNFYAQSDTYSIYGCDGVNKAFEIDKNDVYTPLFTASVPDTPKYIAGHKATLWLAIGASLIASEPGVPYGYNGSFGAAELAVGAPITGMKTQPGEIMSVATERNIWGVYGDGSDTAPYALQLISADAGATDYSFVSLGYPFGLNDQGVVAQQRVTAFGNFEAATISRAIQPIIDQKKVTLTASSVLRKRNQIRFYFADKTAIIIGFGQSETGLQARATTLELAHVVLCICNGAGSLNEERVLFGSSDGKVYEMERGFSFNGEAIPSYLRLNYYNPTGEIRREFHLYGVTPQIKCGSSFTLEAAYEMSYGSADQAPPLSVNLSSGGGFYDQNAWDEFYYDIGAISQTGIKFEGNGTAVALSFYNNDAITKSFAIEGVTFDISPRGFKRAY